MYSAQARRESGFTLIEMVVVAGLIAVLSVVLYRTMSGIIRSRETVEETRAIQRSARYVLQRMTHELSNHSTVSLRAKKGNSSQSGGGGQVGAIGSGKKGGEPSLRFTSSGAGQAVFSGGSNAGVVEIEYWLEDERSSSNRDSTTPGATLIREEIPAGVPASVSVEDRRIAFPMAQSVKDFRLRFNENGKWLEEWPISRSGFPDAIEITLIFVSPDGREHFYRTAVATEPKVGRSTVPTP